MNSIDRYFKDIRELSKDKTNLVENHLKLVVSIAKQYKKTWYPLEDRIQAGNLGLIRAAKTYNPKLGTAFSTYATYYIRSCIREDIMYQGFHISLPRRAVRTNMSTSTVTWFIEWLIGYIENLSFNKKHYNIDKVTAIRKELDTLTDKEQYIIQKHLFERKTFRCIGSELGFTPPRIQQLYSMALAKLRQSKTLQTIYEEE